jgi:hypothetical protein
LPVEKEWLITMIMMVAFLKQQQRHSAQILLLHQKTVVVKLFKLTMVSRLI